MTGYVETSRQDLLAMAGRDPHSLVLLDALFDAAMSETDVDVHALRAHCGDTSDRVQGESLNFLLATFPTRIRSWVWQESESAANESWRQMLAALHTLRHAQLPCGGCLETAWNVDLTRTAVHGPYCDGCFTAHARIPQGRHRLSVVA